MDLVRFTFHIEKNWNEIHLWKRIKDMAFSALISIFRRIFDLLPVISWNEEKTHKSRSRDWSNINSFLLFSTSKRINSR